MTLEPAQLVLVGARLAPLAMLSPLPGGSGVLRIALPLALAVGALPFATLDHDPEGWEWVLALGSELTLGIAFAVAAALPRLALESSGRLLDATSGSVGGRILPIAGLAAFGALGGWTFALEGLASTFEARPLGSPVALDSLLDIAALVTGLLQVIVAFALPGVVFVLGAELAMGTGNRAATGTLTGALPSLRAAVATFAVLLSALAVVRYLPEIAGRTLEHAAELGR
jgi:type III secretory pathway component EscT